MKLYLKDRSDLHDYEVEKVLQLLHSIWPLKEQHVSLEQIIFSYQERILPSFNKVILCFNKGELIGHTEIFDREVAVGKKRKNVMALAGVCVEPRFRGQKIGLKLVSKAFEFVNEGAYSCSIFQTNVPGFYEKINCKQVQNMFINSKQIDGVNKNPWRDPFVMVYPDTYDLENEVIDLLGDGY